MGIIDKEFELIAEFFPNIISVNNQIDHLRLELEGGIILDINYKNYPKKPKILLINNKGEIFKNLDTMILKLKKWKKSNPPRIAKLIKDIENFIKSMSSREVLIDKEFILGVFELCKQKHPHEIIGLLRIKDGIISEFILPPGALSNEFNAVFFPGRLPLDTSIIGTIHSHPSGNPNPSKGDLDQMFKNRGVHIIVAYPYDMNRMKCFDERGQELSFKIV
ncbi:MAG: Mov34/MPN/PAD-1 family protein [Promethearchaeia archaeon]